MENEVLTAKEVSKRLRVGLSQIYEGCARGEIPALRIGRRWLIPRAALDHWLGLYSLPAKKTTENASSSTPHWSWPGTGESESPKKSWREKL